MGINNFQEIKIDKTIEDGVSFVYLRYGNIKLWASVTTGKTTTSQYYPKNIAKLGILNNPSALKKTNNPTVAKKNIEKAVLIENHLPEFQQTKYRTLYQPLKNLRQLTVTRNTRKRIKCDYCGSQILRRTPFLIIHNTPLTICLNCANTYELYKN